MTTHSLEAYGGNWGALCARAVLAILLGIASFLMPGATLGAIVLLFGIYAIVDGVFAIVAAIRGVTRKQPWVWMLIGGVLGVVAGVVTLMVPGLGIVTLTLLVAARAFVTGVLEIAAGIRLRKLIKGEWMLILAGTLSIVFAFLVASRPGAGAVVIAWWLGAFLVLYGMVEFGLSMRVRSWMKSTRPMPA